MNDLKAKKKLYKQTLRPMGIYQIKNLASGKIYLGRSADLNGKINSERFQLRNNMHMNKELQNDFNDLGEEKFSFAILDCLAPKEDPDYDYDGDLQTLEAMWLKNLQPFGAKGYHKKKP
ncbi:MAG: GIY-YIG nuclease family protein [Candidatus Aminicenantes bacterium]|nr:GIY-YIG nuclease family protein [Candidatus Aminicenantes bacterium]